MFDTYTIRPGGGSHYHNHSVTEKRAPTDESVKLLREMENEAKKQVYDSLILPGNTFNAVIHQMRSVELDRAVMLKIIWELNGVKHTTDVDLNYRQVEDVQNDPSLLGDILIKALSEDIAKVMLSASVNQINFRELIY